MRETRCKRHPDTATSLTCGRCGDAVCPRCLVHAPVGVRCPDCGKSKPAPTFDVPLSFMLRGVGAGAAVAAAGSIAIIIVFSALVGIGFAYLLTSLLIAGLGFAIGEAISLATNRKRGMRLKIAAVACVALAVIAILAATAIPLSVFTIIAGVAAAYMATARV